MHKTTTDPQRGERNFYVLGSSVNTTVQYEGEEPQTFSAALFFDTDEFLRYNLVDDST